MRCPVAGSTGPRPPSPLRSRGRSQPLLDMAPAGRRWRRLRGGTRGAATWARSDSTQGGELQHAGLGWREEREGGDGCSGCGHSGVTAGASNEEEVEAATAVATVVARWTPRGRG
jgi:hypothetical protein